MAGHSVFLLVKAVLLFGRPRYMDGWALHWRYDRSPLSGSLAHWCGSANVVSSSLGVSGIRSSTMTSRSASRIAENALDLLALYDLGLMPRASEATSSGMEGSCSITYRITARRAGRSRSRAASTTPGTQLG